MKKLCIVLFLNMFVHAQFSEKIAELYKNVLRRWPSPTPQLCDRFVDFLEYLPKNGVVAEIGVQQGSFSRYIVQKTQPVKLYLIDCWQYQDPTIYNDPEANVNNQLQEHYYHQVKQKFMNDDRVTVLRKFSDQAAELFPDEFFDWVYIDANHSYQAAKDDIALWWPKVKKGGFLAGHDYIIREHFGVLQAVNEFLRDHNLYFYLLTNEEGRHDSWAIQRPLE
jgi:Methyltransferase domain